MSSIFDNFTSYNRESRHISYVSKEPPGECTQVHELALPERCNFIKGTESCRSEVYYFDYSYFLYCTIGSENEEAFTLGILLLVIVLLFYFIVLGTTVDKFFCPVLAVIAKTFRISESVAGVTILAFGNGSPDLFTAVSRIDSDTELMFGELLGGGAFVVGVIAACIILLNPFEIPEFGVTRDVLFFIYSVAWISACAYDQHFKLSDAIVVIVIYVCYLVVVLGEFFWLKRQMLAVESRISIAGEIPSEVALYRELRDETEVIIRSRSQPGSELDITTNRVSEFFEDGFGIRFVPKNHRLFRDFLEHINPLDRDDWKKSGCLARTFAIMRAPILFFLLLIIPVMDYTVERHGWTKLLNMIHWFTLPLMILTVNGFLPLPLLSLPIWALLLIISPTLMFLVFLTSRTDRPPGYHLVYALMVFVGSIQMIYVLAQEIVSLLVTLGLVVKMSKSMLGLSVLAWGNSIGDLFSNITLAKQGYGQMAFAACFGGPLFNLCLGLGITMILKAAKRMDHIAFSREGAMGENCEYFLVQLLGAILLALLYTQYQGRQSVAFIMMMTYCVFLLFCLLGEMKVVHPYGTDHFNEGENP
ncbi:mitochondrial sodium/calcium exchanger protein-like [Toxorhynchites rutilus septentrionalis]|uniref:mitochondrial sodium/calcium exchanger protein-like n=1 Tax=Toxorhynchites rutilus septentrionalis TaxID=329112 RepID=UPI0024783393|nr:mitochondrial sodium/calcium exchanger protein-like [Toxorhynchites rutilus septentrionalis]